MKLLPIADTKKTKLKSVHHDASHSLRMLHKIIEVSLYKADTVKLLDGTEISLKVSAYVIYHFYESSLRSYGKRLPGVLF